MEFPKVCFIVFTQLQYNRDNVAFVVDWRLELGALNVAYVATIINTCFIEQTAWARNHLNQVFHALDRGRNYPA